MSDTRTAQEKEALKQQAYSKATTRLRADFRPEFDDYLIDEYQKVGLVYTPRKSDQQKALETIQNLLEKYPDLAKDLNLEG